MAAEVEEVLAVWREAERAFDALPEEAPERPIIRIHVERLRRCYTRLTDVTLPASRHLIKSTRDVIADTRQLLHEARDRLELARAPLSRADQLMEAWLLAEQQLNRAGDGSPDRPELLRLADEARDRYQAAIDELEPVPTE